MTNPFKRPNQQVAKKYRIDKNTTIERLESGEELVTEDYTKEAASMPHICQPCTVYRRIHPSGRADCHMVMSSTLKTKSKTKL